MSFKSEGGGGKKAESFWTSIQKAAKYKNLGHTKRDRGHTRGAWGRLGVQALLRSGFTEE